MTKPWRLTFSLLTVVALWAWGGEASAQIFRMQRTHHLWGRFAPGSWKLARVVNQTLDANGQLVQNTTSETRTTLKEVTAQAVTLHVEAALEVFGKRFATTPQDLVEDYDGGASKTVPQDLGSQRVIIGGRNLTCRLQRAETVVAGVRKVIETWFSDDVAPFVLKRHTVATDAAGNRLQETTVEVVALNVPRPVLQETKQTAELRVVSVHPKGRSVSQVWIAPDVPGGVVADSSEEFNEADQLVRRTKFELVDYTAK